MRERSLYWSIIYYNTVETTKDESRRDGGTIKANPIRSDDGERGRKLCIILCSRNEGVKKIERGKERERKRAYATKEERI